MDLNTINLDDLLNINEIYSRKTKERRILEYLTQVENLYAFEVNEKLVKISF